MKKKSKDWWEITEGGVVVAWTSDVEIVEELFNDVLQNSRYPSMVDCWFYCLSGSIPDLFSQRLSKKEYSKMLANKSMNAFECARILKKSCVHVSK